MTEQRIGPDKEVTLHFALKLENGDVVDSTFDKQPATFKVGDGNLLPGGQLAGAAVGLAAVAQTGRAVGVPPLQNGAGVDVREADQGAGPLATEGLIGPQEQPDQVPAGLLLGVGATAVAAADLVGREVGHHG